MTGISIVIPTLNEQKYIGRLLRSLEGQEQSPAFEVIVVDCSDDDLTRQAVLQDQGALDLAYVRAAAKDIGAQRNLGAGKASHDLLLFLDADIVLTPGVLQQCSSVSSGQMFVGAVVHKADIDTRLTRAGLAVVYGLIRLARLTGLGVTNGDFLLTSRITFDRIGGFREGYLLGEDTDFGIRAGRAGASYVFFGDQPIIASSRRLAQMSTARLIAIWARAFLRAIFRGPTPRSSGIDYPYGTWT